jgi:hypothetical protein
MAGLRSSIGAHWSSPERGRRRGRRGEAGGALGAAMRYRGLLGEGAMGRCRGLCVAVLAVRGASLFCA